MAGLSSCIDHRTTEPTPGAGRLRVKSITQDLPNNKTYVSAFKYDGQGRLSMITAYQTPDSNAAPIEHDSYQYDSQNRLTQLQRTTPTYSESYAFGYNVTGQLSGFSHSPSGFQVQVRYGPDNRISGYGKTLAPPVSGIRFGGSGVFTFTGNNLTSTTITTSIIRDVFDFGGTSTTNFSFDNKVNPFYGLFVIPAPGTFGPRPVGGNFGPYYTYFGGLDNFFNLSQNNVTSAVVVGGQTTTYAYTYNAANLPTSRITTTGGSVTETLRFDYEPY